jgi:hypothetical protein
MNLNDIVISGNAVYDPKFSGGNGKTSRASLRIASTDRRRDAQGNWVDGDTLFIDVVCWRTLAEHVVQSVGKGTPVIVTGKLRSRAVEVAQEGTDGGPRPDGPPRWVTYYEIDASTVSVNLARVATQPRSTKGPGALRQEEAALAEVAEVMERNAESTPLSAQVA